MRPLPPALLLLLLCACSKHLPEPPKIRADRLSSEVPPLYRPLYDGAAFEFREDEERWRAQLPYETISLERTPCYGPCPVFRLSLHRNGQAELEAIGHLPALGKFTGEVYSSDYGRLCYLLERLHFPAFEARYDAPWTDESTCTITVTDLHGSKTVSDCGDVGPIELWAIEQAIDNVRQNIRWKPSPPKESAP